MAEAAIDMDKQVDELSCVVIPAGADQLLLPNVCVAEIVPWRRVKVIKDSPDWCLGITGWRGITIPVLNYAGFAANSSVPNARCLVVMNRARSSHGRAFYAFAAEALPYMVQLSDGDVANDNSNLSPADVMKVRLGSELATIPDLEYIENMVAQLGG